jgi:hypothetical protein
MRGLPRAASVDPRVTLRAAQCAGNGLAVPSDDSARPRARGYDLVGRQSGRGLRVAPCHRRGGTRGMGYCALAPSWPATLPRSLAGTANHAHSQSKRCALRKVHRCRPTRYVPHRPNGWTGAARWDPCRTCTHPSSQDPRSKPAGIYAALLAASLAARIWALSASQDHPALPGTLPPYRSWCCIAPVLGKLCRATSTRNATAFRFSGLVVIASRVDGSGIGSPPSSIPSICNSRASAAIRRTSSRDWPAVTQPGKSGKPAPQLPLGSFRSSAM